MATEIETGTGRRDSTATVIPRLDHPLPDLLTTSATIKSSQERASRHSCLHALSRQVRHEGKKVLRLQVDCGLYGNDWRIVYGGAAFRFVGPCLLLTLRAALFVAHLTVLLIDRIYEDMLFFTSWTNIVALVYFFTCTLTSMAAIGSLSRQRRLSEASVGAGRCRSALCCFDRAEVQYRALMNEKTRGSPAPAATLSPPPLRKCFAFRRPFSGGRRMIALETLLTCTDIALFLVLPAVIIMFVVYWAMLYPRKNSINWRSVYLHLYAPVAAWLLAISSRNPYRLSLIPIFIAYGLCYIITVVVAQHHGTGFVYWFLNFIDRPGLALGMALSLLLIFGPGLSFVAWLILFRKNAAVDRSTR
ncbi:hypothetical protein ACSSS7_002335 [Eimeria intestinalis]